MRSMSRGMRSLQAVVVTALALLGVGVTSPAQASVTTVVTSYGADTVNQALTVYEPSTPGPHPAILYVHGGCWQRGTLQDAEVRLAQDIANKSGFVVATMTYRLDTPTGWCKTRGGVAARA